MVNQETDRSWMNHIGIEFKRDMYEKRDIYVCQYPPNTHTHTNTARFCGKHWSNKLIWLCWNNMIYLFATVCCQCQTSANISHHLFTQPLEQHSSLPKAAKYLEWFINTAFWQTHETLPHWFYKQCYQKLDLNACARLWTFCVKTL